MHSHAMMYLPRGRGGDEERQRGENNGTKSPDAMYGSGMEGVGETLGSAPVSAQRFRSSTSPPQEADHRTARCVAWKRGGASPKHTA